MKQALRSLAVSVRHSDSRRSRGVGILVTALALFHASSVLAQAPTAIPFQGLLLDDVGAPITAAVDLDFELFDAITAGASLWSESHADVPVVDGVYSVDLGSSVPVTPDLLAGGAVFLEITVDGETLAPRQQLLSVPFALVAEEARTVADTPSLFFQQVAESFSFDGQDPPNTHPDEGTADVDGDGQPNFIDPDNDNDGIPDGVEFATGRSINVLSPDIASVAPPVVTATKTTTVTVSGSNFDTLASVAFGAESPVASGLGSTSFMVDVSPPTPTSTTDLVVTLSNGESARIPLPVDPVRPVITDVTPPTIDSFTASTLVVTGTDFDTLTAVTFGAETPTPNNLSSTQFEIDVLAETLATALPVGVTLANGESTDSTPVVIQAVAPTITSVSPPFVDADVPTEITISGTGFYPGTTVTLGALPFPPSAITPTSITVTVDVPPTQDPTLVVTHPNTLTAEVAYAVVPPNKLVFVTLGQYDGDLGGLAGADALCQSEAAAAGLSGTFLAWLSESQASPSSASPLTRFLQHPGPYIYTSNGAQIAGSFVDLVDGALDRPITVGPGGETGLGGFVWTGTQADGSAGLTAADTCNEWTSATGSGDAGAAIQSGSGWTSFINGANCQGAFRLYCFEQ